MDGNHRLHFGAGDPKAQWPRLTTSIPFAMTIGLAPEAEASLFMDINDNQKAMNTAHLAHLKARLTGPERLAVADPALWIAEHLTDDLRMMVRPRTGAGSGPRARPAVNLAALKRALA
jgi:hypothetical protein